MQWFRFLSFDLFKPMFKAWLAFEELKATVELSPEDAAQEAQRRRREQWIDSGDMLRSTPRGRARRRDGPRRGCR